MNKYLVLIEDTATGYSAYSPDLPGCIATGESRSEIQKNIKEAIAFHLDGLREEGFHAPTPQTEAIYCEV